MKISKALGFGILLHIALVAILVVQPSCMTMDVPTQTYQQSQTFGSTGSDDSISSSRTDSILDPEFNAGLDEDADNRFSPVRPGDSEFSEFEGMPPKLSPILSDPIAPAVDIAGPSFKIHTVQKGESLWAISRRYNVSLDELYAANGLNKNSILKIGQQIKIPVEGSTASIKTVSADTYQPSGYNMDAETYTVVRGDTLSQIARRFNTTVSMIKTVNNKNSDVIRVGEKLNIPVNSRTSGSSRSTTTSAGNTSSPASGSSQTHIVKAGEYPATIARQYGMSTSELLAINAITDPRSIQVGQRLKVNPGSSSRSTSAPQPSSASTVTVTAPAVVRPQPANNASGNKPVEIRVVEADPLIESELGEIDADSIFENVEEIPVVPLDE